MTSFDDESRSAELLDRSWDDNADAWTQIVRSGGIESRRVATDAAILDAVVRYSPGTVVDVGCGEGWLCRALRNRGQSCIGVDGSSELIRKAQLADPDGEYHQLRYADFDRLGSLLEGHSVTGAVCNFSLLHEDLTPILRALYGALRPGGVLLIQTIHPWSGSENAEYVDGWRSEDFGWASTPFPQRMPWYFRTLESWLSVVHESGFVIERLEEPAHPQTTKPASLLLIASRPGV